ncbi:MAG TPA: transglutaminase family protein [Opitutus sp.]|nr:transglutaminase family protein [Opitutus sp.]
MFLRVVHLSRYDYSSAVSFAPHALYLRPRETQRQRLHQFDLAVSPAGRRIATNDAEDNALDWIYFDAATTSSRLEIRSEFLVETLDTNPFDFFLEPHALKTPFTYTPADTFTLGPCFALPRGAEPAQLQTWLATHLPDPPSDTIAFLSALNSAVHAALAYGRRAEPGIQTPAETIARCGGSCRDYAVLLIALCRHLGIAARFVSGYLHEPPDPALANPLPPDMHAWAEVYLPGAGWRGLDSTRGIFCDDRFVAVAHSALAESVNPVQGRFFSPTPATSQLTTHLTIDGL